MKTPEIFVGLDLATKCGYAIMQGRELLHSGRWDLFKNTKLHSHRAVRWLNFECELTDLVSELQPVAIGYERVRRHGKANGVAAAHVYGGLLASLERLDMQWQQAYGDASPLIVPIEPNVWRKLALSKGNATKQDAVRWAERRFSISVKSEDEAEAIGVADSIRLLRERGQL